MAGGDEERDLRGALDACRTALGTRSSSFWHSRADELRLAAPHWLEPDDGLARVFEEQERIFVQGRVALGALVQANTVLLQDGDVGAPVALVHSADRHFEEHPGELLAIANRIFRLKRNEPSDSDEERLATFIRDDMARETCLRLAPTFTGGREVFLATTYVDRRRLPKRWLAQPLFPVLVAPEPRAVCVVLPSQFWPAEWLASWSEAAPNECQHPRTRRVPGRGILVPVILLVAQALVWLVCSALGHGDPHALERPFASSGHLLVGGVGLIASVPWLRRTSRRVYLRPDCDHRVEVERDDRFVKLPIVAWGAIFLAMFAWQILRGPSGS